MTVDVFTPAPFYPAIASAGPYAIGHDYASAEEITVRLTDGETETVLAPGDFVVSPAGPAPDGTVTLTPSAYAMHAGSDLRIVRATRAQQGWLGTSARERGLEQQLDRQVMIEQDLQREIARTPALPWSWQHTDRPMLPFPEDGKTLVGRRDGRGYELGPGIGTFLEAADRASRAASAAEAAQQANEQSLFVYVSDDDISVRMAVGAPMVIAESASPFPSVTLEVAVP